MARKTYSGSTVATTTTGCTAAATSIPLAAGGGATYPTGSVGPFVVVVGPETANEEQVLCSGKSGDALTVATNGRNWHLGGSATGVAHGSGEAVRHVLDADSVDEANAHVNDDARDDHSQYLNATRHDVEARHAFGSGLGTPGAAGTSGVGDAPATGSGDDAAREDHVHGREAFATPVAVGAANAAGSATTIPRSDHVHAGVATPGAWTPYTPVLTNASLGNGVLTGSYVKIGRKVTATFQLAFGSTTSITGLIRVGLPENAATGTGKVWLGAARLSDSGTREYVAVWRIDANTWGYFVHTESTGAGSVTDTTPFTWAVNDALEGTVTYEAAS